MLARPTLLLRPIELHVHSFTMKLHVEEHDMPTRLNELLQLALLALEICLGRQHHLEQMITQSERTSSAALKLSLHREKHRLNTDFLRNDRDMVVEMR